MTNPAQSIADAPEVFNQPPRFMHMRHLEINVVEAAKQRIRWLIEEYDEVVVAFSGGKDSLVVLNLVEQVYRELGRTDKVKAKFMDEELVNDQIMDFMEEIAESERFDLKWYCLQMYVGFFVMGKHKPFVTWDPNRPWHRKPPDRPYVIYDIGVDTKHCNENTISHHMYPENDGKVVCELVGVRADESMKRFLSVVGGGKGEAPAHVSVEAPGKLVSARPIYDWTEMDIFKFLKDNNIRYCPCYDSQVWSKSPLRVASAMHERGIAQFMKLKELSPKFYSQLRAVYPEIETHYRYFNEMKVAGSGDDNKYAHTFDGIRAYIGDHIDPSHKKEALEYVTRYEVKRRNNLVKAPHAPLGNVSVKQVFHLVQTGKFVKGAALNHQISQSDLDYELDVKED
jgi:predicted phosphoadenosine phosphosulfate sulfurtransferase